METYKPFTHQDHIDPFHDQQDFAILTGTSNILLAEATAKRLGKPLARCSSKFANEEIKTRIAESVRGRQVFIINSTGYPKPNDSHMEVCFMADASKRCAATEITAVEPYMGYSREDRLNQGRGSLSVAVVFSHLEVSGVSRVITLDMHSEQSAAAPIARKDFLYGSYILAPALRQQMPDNPTIVAADAGTTGRAGAFRGLLGITDAVVQVSKLRDPESGKTQIVGISGDVAGKDAIIVDDVISSGGTTADNAKFLKETQGAKSVIAVATHAEFVGKGLAYFDEPWVDKVLILDTIAPSPKVLNHPKIEVYSAAPLLSEAIFRTFHNHKVSELFRATAPLDDVILLNPKEHTRSKLYSLPRNS